MVKGTALITGSSKGLGRSLALEFAEEDYNLILTGRNTTNLDSLEAEIRENKGKLTYSVIGDITQKDTIRRLVLNADAGNLDVLVNNAGIYLKKEIAETSEEEFRKVMETDFFSQVDLTRKLLPILTQRRGVIININSIAGIDGNYGEGAYAAAKHALRGFSESLRYEVTKKGVKVIDVFLGAMQTQMTADRDNRNLLINPDEAARYIVQTYEFARESESVYPKEIHLGRCNYG